MTERNPSTGRHPRQDNYEKRGGTNPYSDRRPPRPTPGGQQPQNDDPD